ncbi:hypothetical protein NIES2107_06600 [Nostoc carneum NIES-2107]|nr:hypothetical protein NIES2107_06600 [Nostoc carneum NIES-2107]
MRDSRILRYHNNQELITLTSILILLLWLFFSITLAIFSWQLIPEWYLFKCITSGIILLLIFSIFIYIFIAIIVRISHHLNKRQGFLARIQDVVVSILVFLIWIFATFLFVTQSLGAFSFTYTTLNKQVHYPAYAKTIYIYESSEFLEKSKTYSLWIQNGWLPIMHKQTDFTSLQPIKAFNETCLNNKQCLEAIIQLAIDDEFVWNLNLKTGKHWYLNIKTGKTSQDIRSLRNNYEL